MMNFDAPDDGEYRFQNRTIDMGSRSIGKHIDAAPSPLNGSFEFDYLVTTSGEGFVFADSGDYLAVREIA